MNTDYVREFLTFSRSLNYSMTAKELYISRSALRDHIAELEFELKVPLVDKTGDVPKLTPYGRKFLERGEGLCRYLDDVLAEFEGMKDNYLSVRLSYATLVWLRPYLLKARAKVIADNPEKCIEITTLPSPSTSAKALFEGTEDVGILRTDAGMAPQQVAELFSGLKTVKVARSRILFFTGMDNPVAQPDKVALADLQGQTLLAPDDILEAYRTHDQGSAFGMTLAAADINDFLEYYLADYSRAIGTVPEVVAGGFGLLDRFDCKILNIEGLEVYSDFYVACREEYLQNPTAQLFFDELCHQIAMAPQRGAVL